MERRDKKGTEGKEKKEREERGEKGKRKQGWKMDSKGSKGHLIFPGYKHT